MRADFGERLLAWFDRHGRRDLPWQHPRTPYRVWVAEIMLQQTQVAAVIGYFERFMGRFPDIRRLAAADLDAVMQQWAGLGYYARARNLHAAARIVVAEHDGELPDQLDALMALPGIGRSTAGALLAQAFGKRAAILDGNAKRVLARYDAVVGAPGEAAFEKTLWQAAEHYTPRTRPADYTQAIMDLGATVCLRRGPVCHACPLAADCAARLQRRETEFPAPRKRRTRPLRAARFLVVRRGGDQILLERRPPAGIWGGLWALPEIPAQRTAEDYCRHHLGFVPQRIDALPKLRHGFTHFELDIQPLAMRVTAHIGIMDAVGCAWYPRTRPPALPAPIARLIRQLPEDPP